METLEGVVGISFSKLLAGVFTITALALPFEADAKNPLGKVCNLEALYLGGGRTPRETKRLLRGGCTSVDEKQKIDFGGVLDALWDYKNSGRARGNGAAKQAAKLVLERYNDNKRLTTLENYVKTADKVTLETFQNFDFKEIAEEYKLDSRQQKVFKRALGTIHGREIIAYGMTELFPSHNGKRNRNILDYLLRNAGASYLEGIPAMYDRFSSYGMWQFTQYAVFDAHGKEEGASKMSNYLPQKYQIPGSVNMLDGEDHVRTAYLFSAHNLAVLVSGLSNKQLMAFEKYLTKTENEDNDDLVQYIATAHHLPGKARKFAERWLTSGAKRDYRASTSGRLKAYATKTKANYGALIPIKRGR